MKFLGTGSAVPAAVLTNDMLSEMVDTSDEWIVSRTGIRERRIAREETTLSLACEAARIACETAEAKTGFSRSQIDLVICATTSCEDRCPALACSLQRDLGLREDLFAFDLNAACSGFIYALIVASRFIAEGRTALVVGTEVLTRLVDFTDRGSCVLFGDGAGAAVIAPIAPGDDADDAAADNFTWFTETSGNSELLSITDDIIRLDGSGIFKFAVDVLARAVLDVTQKAQVSLEEIDLFVCHQANERIIKSAAKRLGVPIERFFMNLSKYGNTSAASIPLVLDEAVRAGIIREGSRIVIAGFGGGLTAGAACFTWR